MQRAADLLGELNGGEREGFVRALALDLEILRAGKFRGKVILGGADDGLHVLFTGQGAADVHICGAVSAPGVYELPAGSRIIDAVEAGGGFLPEADEACCNLAEEIVDGCQIYIMTKSESCADGQAEKKAGIQTSPDSDMQTTDINVRSNSTTALENGLVNLNTADVAALMTLPGIGESRAKAIISYREQQGAFTKIEDIMKISGIKQAAFSKIKDKITV